MRRAPFAVFLPVITALAAIIPAASAQAREPVRNTPATFPAGFLCPFEVHIGVVSDNEYFDTTTLADGTTITQIRGRLVESFTNDATGTTIVRNVSGPTTTTGHLDGTSTEVGEGNNWWGFGPHSRANTGQPGLIFTSGRAVLNFNQSNFITSYSLSGTQENACALLAG
jgi:hypothetical protein